MAGWKRDSGPGTKGSTKERRLDVEKARMSDAPHIHSLVNEFADRGEMLPRALSEVYEHLRDFFVVRDEDRLVACAALHIYWSDLAEIRGMAVETGHQGRGIGRSLVNACLGDAGRLGIQQVFCLTYKPGFFEKFSFRQVDTGELPRKVWAECYRCPKFPNCDEVALIYQAQPPSA
jgi:amino-acid N-acetyltransferase